MQSINEDEEVAEVKTKEEDSWAIVAKKMRIHNVFERLESVESHMNVKMSVIRKEVKSCNEEETRKRRIMIFQSEIQDRKIRCEVCKGCVCKDGCRSEL